MRAPPISRRPVVGRSVRPLAAAVLLCAALGVPALAQAPTESPPPAAAPTGPPAAEAAPAPAPAPETPAAAPVERRLAGTVIHVYPKPMVTAARRGLIHKGQAFEVEAIVPGKGCKAGWGQLVGQGYACLDKTTPTDAEPVALPALIAFDAPLPEEFPTYVKTGVWERSSPDEATPLVPFIYAKRWRRWQGPFYASVKDFEAGIPAEDQLEPHRKFRFVGTRQTRKGEVLVRPDGMVVPIDRMYVYPITDFVGRDLRENPLPPGQIQGWVHGYDGAPLLAAPAEDSAVLSTLDYHTWLGLDAAPADPAGRFWKVEVNGMEGYVDLRKGVRRFNPQPRNPEIDPAERWIDIDVDQQTLALYEGDLPVYLTLISSGEPGHGTPQGIFRISDKMAWTDMMSREDAEEAEVYWVEAVPWTMHFAFRYAIHASWWHWGYGNKASHGCVNLSPRDAKYIYDRVGPHKPPGWHTIYETAEDLGTTVRIRLGDQPVRDRRIAPEVRWKGNWGVTAAPSRPATPAGTATASGSAATAPSPAP